jgi:single-strand DNA-binding protein
MLNNIVLIGRLTRDPELRYTTSNGTAVATFTLAVNRRFKGDGGQEADFVPVVVWRNQAENCAKYISKGSLVAVEGRLQIRPYEDKEGKRRTIAEVVANSVQFLDTKKSSSQSDSMGAPTFDDSMIGDDDVPF